VSFFFFSAPCHQLKQLKPLTTKGWQLQYEVMRNDSINSNVTPLL